MCGLFFVIQRHKPIDQSRFAAAFKFMSHRGPDATVYRYGECAVATPHGPATVWWGAGHHRLSILDLDPRSNQPFIRHGALLVYNGEAYDYERLRAHPSLAGAQFETRGDTEVLFEGLRRAGPGFVENINGMWALAFADFKSGKVHASRDRFGKKPLFWRMDDETLCLSSTLGVVDRYLGRSTQHDPEALASFLTHGAAYPGGGTRTAHLDIRQVAPSSTITFDLANWRSETAAHFSFETPHGFDPAEPLADVLADAVRLRLVSDRPVGLLLSGGVDLSLLLSIAHAKGFHEQLQCFIGETGRSDDARYARESVASLGIKAEVVNLGYDNLSFDRFLNICRHQEKPFPLIGNAMGMAEMYEKVAGHGIPVVLDGTGGDELFGGYWARYFPFAARDAWARRDARWLFNVARADRSRVREIYNAVRRASTERIRPFLREVAKFDTASQRSLDPLADNTLKFNQALRVDAAKGRLGEWLWQNDRNAMMSSIENRSPLLDFRLTAFLSDPYPRKFNGSFNKVRLREAFSSFGQLPTQWRVQKQGFRWNRRAFLLDNRSSVIDLLAASRTIDRLIDRKRFIDTIVKDDRSLRSTTTARLLSIAGVSEAMNS